MLVPQFTIRRLFVWTTAMALLAVVAGFARQGNLAARSLILIVLMLAALFVAFAALYSLAWLWSRAFQRHQQVGQSPFAEHRPPPQMIRPEEPV